MTRANGTLETLAAAPREQILDSMAPLIDALASSWEGAVATKRSAGILLFRVTRRRRP